MRSFFILVLLGVILVSIGLVARSGLFRRKNPGEPANIYARDALINPMTPQLSWPEAEAIARDYPGAEVTASGLRYIVRQRGAGGAKPQRGQTVTAHYAGRLLLTGAKFDSSYDEGRPLAFQVGVHQVIPGWDIAFLDMTKGESRTLIIPWWLAYGEPGRPPKIPPRATLVFDVELIDFR